MPKITLRVCVFVGGLVLATLTNAAEKSYTLLDIYQQALAHDPTLASALSANQAAQEIIEQGKALYRPTVNFNADANTIRSNIRYLDSPLPSGNSSFETYKVGVDARQPIYSKQNLVQIEQSQTQVSLADKQLHQAQQALILRTTQAYFDVLIAQDKINLILAQKAAIKSQLEQANANFEVGNATITDVNEAQARYDLTVAQEIAAVNAYEVAKHAVQAITGEFPQKFASVRADLSTNQLEQGVAQWLEVALQNNLNIQLQQDAVKLSEQEIERAKAGHLPTLDAVASYTNSYANGSVSVFGTGNELKTGTIGLQLQIPLYQGGATSSRVRQAVLNQQKAQNDVEVARRATELETRRAYLDLSSNIAQIKALEQALISGQSQLDSTALGYEVGVRTSVDVLNAQQQLFTTKQSLLEARYQYLVNIIRLKAAAGVVAEVDLADINQQLVQVGAH
ncbi:MAG: TolC family outer membrane protein [Methylotenera sp.]|jgi:outer membrane protein|nr:TolC family outer membrane protein [Methylotenera sp.]